MAGGSSTSLIPEYPEQAVYIMDFWSTPEDAITVTNVAADKALPSVTVAGIPTGATILRAVALIKFRALVNTDAVNPNALDGAQEIQVDDSVATGWLDCINFIADMFTVDINSTVGGDVFIGAIDVKARVDGNDTYSFQWDEALADSDGLTFNDIQTGLRIWWH